MTNSATSAVSLVGVSKCFNDVPALDQLSVEAPKGKISVLLGPNGAGKTTAMRVVTGAMSADSGSVTTLGIDPEVDGENVRRRCGVVSAKPALYDRLSGEDNLLYAAALYEVPTAERGTAIRNAAGRFGIDGALHSQVGGYSTGMKTRLALARSVLHQPELLLFDEPTSGLDPESAHAVLGLIREMTTDGHTVVMCTHHLVEAEGLADHVVVLDSGTNLVEGAPSALVRRYWPDDRVDIGVVNAPGSFDQLKSVTGVRSFEPMDQGVRVVIDSSEVVPAVVKALVAGGYSIDRVVPHEPSLEALYFEVRRSRRDIEPPTTIETHGALR